MDFYSWDWSGADKAALPVKIPTGSRILGSVNIADLQDEARNFFIARGPLSAKTRISRLRLDPSGIEVPEGGREVNSLTLHRPLGAKALILRASFDRPGKLVGGGFKAWKGTDVKSSYSEFYSEVLLPLPDDGGLVTVMFRDDAGDGQEWAVYRVWFVD